MDLSIRVIAFNTFCDRSRFASRHPHLSVVQVFKDRFCCAVSFDSSAAERRDYEELSTTRQALLAKFLTTLAPPHTAENPRRCSEVRIIYTPNPPSIPFRKIVGNKPTRCISFNGPSPVQTCACQAEARQGNLPPETRIYRQPSLHQPATTSQPSVTALARQWPTGMGVAPECREIYPERFKAT